MNLDEVPSIDVGVCGGFSTSISFISSLKSIVSALFLISLAWANTDVGRLRVEAATLYWSSFGGAHYPPPA